MPINVDRYADIAGEVLKVYEEAELVMQQRVAKRLIKGITQPGWTENKMAEMQDVTRQMKQYMGGVTEKRRKIQRDALNQAYSESRKAAINEAYQFTTVTGIQGLTANTMKVVNIMAELDASMNAADRRILRSINDEYANIVGRSSALVATGSITYREAVTRELEHFANRGIVSFVDKAGRHWDMETYSEMATLTAVERATREGYLDTIQEFGFDLVEVSSHYGACPLCEPWQGVVLSVSGTTPGYHTLAEAEGAGLFHPRCLHDISTYHVGISRGGRLEPRPVTMASPAYTVRQQQRSLERHVRKWKRRMSIASDPQAERDAYNRVRMYQEKIRQLRDDYNEVTPIDLDYLPRKYWREGGRVKLSAAARKLPNIS